MGMQASTCVAALGIVLGLSAIACGGGPVAGAANARPAPEPTQAADEVVLSWRREGGIAGFCDEMKVWANGELRASSCRPGGGSRAGRLSKEEAARLDRWRRSFGAVDVQTKDPGEADAMTTTLSLKGTGSAQPGESERQEILDWAHVVYTRNQP